MRDCERCAEPRPNVRRVQVIGAYGDLYLYDLCELCEENEPRTLAKLEEAA